MPPLDQIRESIEARIDELNGEISALQAARAALDGESPASTGSTKNSGGEGRRRRTRKSASIARSDDAKTKIATGAAADAAGLANDDSTSSASRQPAPRTRTQRKSARKPLDVSVGGKLEAILRDAEDGLSAISLSKHSNTGYKQVVDHLRALERTGRARRTGGRRTSLWRLVSDEERIADRAAELERLSTTKSETSPDRR